MVRSVGSAILRPPMPPNETNGLAIASCDGFVDARWPDDNSVRSLSDTQLIGSFDVWLDGVTGSVMSRFVSNSNGALRRTTAVEKQMRIAPREKGGDPCDCKAGLGELSIRACGGSMLTGTATATQPLCNDESCCVNLQTKVECPLSSHDCENQRLQRGQWARLGLFQDGAKGYGLCALEDLKTGSLVCEYRGIRKRRPIRTAGDEGRYLAQVDGIFIDAAHSVGEPGRMCNHSCEPNCKLEKWTVGTQSRLAIVCTGKIQRMEPITVDYQMIPVGTPTPCFCGASTCRGVIASASWVQKNRRLLETQAPQRQSQRILILKVDREKLEELALRDQLRRDLLASIHRTQTPDAENSPSPIYACSFRVYGCRSVFWKRNEWKRHVNTIHLRLELYRCDREECRSANYGYHEFNRKDLFIAHLRRIHAQDKVDYQKCQQIRKAPSLSWCADCKEMFDNWDDRMEHMARHYKQHSGFEESEDLNLSQWALREGLLRRDRGSNKLVCA